jgi:hypothetical protein
MVRTPSQMHGRRSRVTSGQPRARQAGKLADKTGLTGGLSHALASPRLLIHHRGRVTADLACAIADGGARAPRQPSVRVNH